MTTSPRFMRAATALASPVGLVAVTLIGAACMFAVWCYPLFVGHVYIEDDLSAFNLPLRFFYQQCLRTGESPIWMPSMFCGFYLHGEGQAGMYHPLHFLLYRHLPLCAAFNLELLINYPLIFIGLWLLMRRWRIPAHAAAFGATLFTFCGFCFSNYLHIMIPSVIAYTPWLLLCIDLAMRGSSPRTLVIGSLGVTVLTALQILLGFPQCVYFSSLIEGLYVLFLLPHCRRRVVVLALGGAKALAVLIGAIQILPQMGTALDSVRLAPSYEFVMAGSMHPMNLLQIVSPYLFNRHGWVKDLSHFWDPPYFGAVTPVLLVWLILRRKQLGSTRYLMLGCFILAALGIVLALGEYGYLYRLVRLVPWLNKFRNSSRHILLYHLAVAVLVAIAYADLCSMAAQRGKMPWPRVMILALPALLSAGIAVAVLALQARPGSELYQYVREHLAPNANIWLGAILMACAAGLVIAAARGHPLAALAIVLFTLADVSLYGLRHKPHEDLNAFINAIEVPPNADGYRIDPNFRPVWAYTGPTTKGYRVVQGYAAINPANRLDYARSIAALRVAGVCCRKTRRGGPPELAAAADQGIAWWPVPDPLPRARLVTRTQVTNDPRRDIERIDIATTALVNDPIALDEGPPGEVTITDDRPGHITLAVSAPGQQLLILSERYHSGWTASVDGTNTPILRAYGDFMACPIPPGRHQIHFDFAPSDLAQGKRLTALGLVLAILCHAILLFCTRAPQNVHPCCVMNN